MHYLNICCQETTPVLSHLPSVHQFIHNQQKGIHVIRKSPSFNSIEEDIKNMFHLYYLQFTITCLIFVPMTVGYYLNLHYMITHLY